MQEAFLVMADCDFDGAKEILKLLNTPGGTDAALQVDILPEDQVKTNDK